MGVSVHVTSIDKENKTVIVEAYNGTQKVFKSPMKYKTQTRKHIESVLRKELKAFDKPIWGGFDICFLCRIGDED